MKTSTIMKRALCSTIIAGFAMTAAPAIAQDADEDDIVQDRGTAGEAPSDTIIVTGTRLNVNPNLEAASPVLSVSDAQIEARGVTRIEDLTNQLPQVFAGQAGEVSNGASGTATLNLRGLGATRTLVLIDGKRLPYGSSSFSAPNLDLIPTQLIDRVDILTGGASAVYGSDAVAGVANFILKRDFEGLELDFAGGFAQNGNEYELLERTLVGSGVPVPGDTVDGEEYTVTAIFGANTADDRGNVTIYGSYERRYEITQDNRTISACTLGGSSGAAAFGGVGCVGSGNFRIFGGDGGTVFQQAEGALVPFVGGPAQTYNFGPRNFFQRPSERFQIYGRAHYEVTDNIEAFADLSYTDNVSDAQVAETASFGAWSINCDNPFLDGSTSGTSYYDIFDCSAADIANGTVKDGLLASHRNVEGGPRNSRLENSAFRLVGGFRGSFADVWNFEVFGQYAETSDTSIGERDFIVANVQQAFLAVDDGMGNVVCQDQSGGCVPYNIFQRGPGGESLVTQEQTDYLQGVGIVVGSTDQTVVGANVQANLGDYGLRSPLSSEGVAFLIGGEYREDNLASVPDEISRIAGGGFTGVGGATLPVTGSIEVYEAYGELQVPLITDTPFFEELVVSGQYRYSDYTANGNDTSTGFTTDAYGVQATWIPIEDIKLRGQYQRSVRAPNVIELYTGQDVGLPNLGQDVASGLYDPCASANPIASAAACANTGVTAAQFGNITDVFSGQTQGIFGGNPDLQPEVSDTWTYGVVLTPQFVPGLTLSADYFDITVDNFIAAGIGAQTTLDNCLATGDAAFCDLITRDARGSLNSGTDGVGFLLTNINIAQLTTNGIDAQVNYNTSLGNSGDLLFTYAGTYLTELDYIPFPGGDPIQCDGFLNNDCVAAVNPKYRHIASLTYQTNFDLDLTATWRHFSGTQNEAVNPITIDDQLPSVDYLDISFNYDLLESVGLRGGILNVANQQAPLSASSGPPTGNGNTYPVIYDTGRFFFLGVNFSF